MKRASLTIFFILLTTICLADESIDKRRTIDNYEEEQMYSFALDVIQSIKHICDSKIGKVAWLQWDQIKNNDPQRTIFGTMSNWVQEVDTNMLQTAETIIGKWTSSKNVRIRWAADELTAALYQSVKEKDAFLTFCADVKQKPNAYDSATREIYTSSHTFPMSQLIIDFNTITSSTLIVHMVDDTIHKTPDELWEAIKENKPIHFKLSKKHLDSIFEYIDYHFSSDLDEYNKHTEKDREYGMSHDPLYGIAKLMKVIKMRAK